MLGPVLERSQQQLALLVVLFDCLRHLRQLLSMMQILHVLPGNDRLSKTGLAVLCLSEMQILAVAGQQMRQPLSQLP